jgi:hypothetical protein
MADSLERFFDEINTIGHTMDGITIVPEREKLDILSRCITSLRAQIPQIKNNLNHIENHSNIESKEDELPVLVERYVNIHREMVSLAVELIDAIDQALEIFETTRQAECPNCPVGEALINGTCGKCGAKLDVSDNSVWRRFRENRERIDNVSSRFVQKIEDSVSATDALTGYFE